MKMILKVLALPVLFVVTIACILGNFLANLSSYVIALLLLVIAGCSIYCIVKALWISLVILAGMGINGNPYNLSVAMGSCKTRNFGKSYQRVYFLIKMGEADGQRIYGALL